jgi:hypothetical protein
MCAKWCIAAAFLYLMLFASCSSTKNNRFGNQVQKTGKQAQVQKKSKPKINTTKRRSELQSLDFLGGESSMDRRERRQKARSVDKAEKQKEKEKEAGLADKKTLTKKQKKALADKKKAAMKRHMDIQDKATQKRMKKNLKRARKGG